MVDKKQKAVQFIWPDKLKDMKNVDRMSMAIIMQRGADVYSDNWAAMSLESLISAAAYKCERARFTNKPSKKLDDLFDAINFLRFASVRVIEQMREMEPEKNEQKQ